MAKPKTKTAVPYKQIARFPRLFTKYNFLPIDLQEIEWAQHFFTAFSFSGGD
jgi:hypothetical protein